MVLMNRHRLEVGIPAFSWVDNVMIKYTYLVLELTREVKNYVYKVLV